MIGKTISHYKILEKLGEGGMGVVYKAEDLKLKRIVALKFLPPELTRDPEAKERFIQEAQAASALDHPNICTIHEIDETADGQLFIVMACYEGDTLKKKIASGQSHEAGSRSAGLSVDSVIDIAIQIAQGLVKAHEHGIVHRDIKPGNIMITKDGMVKILDFGLAKLVGQVGLTKTGKIFGTVAYMSPEQARGEEVDHRTDIWSFGVLLYEMITGLLPFRAEYDQAVLYSILNEQPEPITTLRSEVLSEIDTIVSKCIEKESDRRFQTADDLLTDLMQVQSGEVLRIPSIRKGLLNLSHFSRNRIFPIVGALSIIAIISILLCLFSLSRKQRIPKRKMLAVLPFENLGPPEDDYFSDGATEEIMSRLAAIHGLGVISRTSIMQYKNTEKTLQEIGKELGVDYILEGTIRWQRLSEGLSQVRVTPQLIRVSDDIHLWSDHFDAVLADIFDVQSTIAEKVAEALDITLLEPERHALATRPTKNMAAYQAYLLGVNRQWDINVSRENKQLAVEMLQRSVELDPDFAQAYAGLSEAHSFMYHLGFDRTKDRLAMAKAAVDRAIELQPRLPEACLALGIYYYMGHRDYDRALEAFATVEKAHPNNTRAIHMIGVIWKRQGKFESALKYFKRAFELSPRDAFLANEILNCYMYLRKYSEAKDWADITISLAPDRIYGYYKKVLTYWLWEGDLQKARMTLEAIPNQSDQLAVFEWSLQELFEGKYQAALFRLTTTPVEFFEHQAWLVPKVQLMAQLYELMGKQELACSFYDSAVVLLAAEVKKRSDDFRVRGSLGLVYASLDRKEDALREGKFSVEICPISKYAIYGSYRLRDLALIYAKIGRYKEALDQIDFLLSIPSHFSVSILNIDPRWQMLRNHPRYINLIEKHSHGDKLR
jgi:serine/threonine protein kinase/tetratricopeptide (TPR) repeat protein